jgi:hypothetical protein
MLGPKHSGSNFSDGAIPAQIQADRPMTRIQHFLDRLEIFAEFWHFMKVRKKWWLGPLLLVLLLLSLFIVLIQGSALAPFIYTLF